MELSLPMLVSRKGPRLLHCWLPHWPELSVEGTSLSELKDDLALEVMERFLQTSPAEAWRFQVAPHLKLKRVTVDTVAKDPEDGRSYALQGKVSVLLEKWPDDDFWLATPTQAPALAFPLQQPSELDEVLAMVLRAHCLKTRAETLAGLVEEPDERLELLDVDADAPTALPKASVALRVKRATPKTRGKDAAKAGTTDEETPEQKEQRRARARLAVSTLRQIGKNLAHQARDGELGRAYGREALVNGLVETLLAREGVGLVLVGEGGVGKTALVHEVTRRFVDRLTSRGTRRDVWRVDGNQFIAGMSYVGQWEARARQLVQELKDTGDVLYVDDLASLVYAGRHSKGDTHVAQYLEPHLARGELTVVAECSPERFERVKEEAPSFAALFDVVQVPALSEAQSLSVLLGVLRELEASEPAALTPRLTPDVLELVLSLSGRFFSHRALPGRAVRVLEQVLSGEGVVEGQTRRFRATDAFEAVRRETGLPDFVLGGAPPKTRAQLVRELSSLVAGQPEAVEAAVDAVLTLQLSVQDPDKPLANYLFVGPTGVGKTETAKALASLLFGSPERLVRFDMSELATPDGITRLLGTPGAPDGELVTALRTQPFCVVLFDEVEKAHPRVFDALLQFLGEGRLTDAKGHTLDGRNAVVVMTSNLGVREAASTTGFGEKDPHSAAQHYVAAAKAFFRPELFNRLDRVVPFRSLDQPALRRVVERALQGLLSRRGLRHGNVLVDVEPELLELLVEQAFDPRYGARPLKRLLEKKLAVPLAHHLLGRTPDELAVVELLRRADDVQLSVRLLARAATVPLRPADGWTLPKLTAEARKAKEHVARLLETKAARALASARAATLRSAPSLTEAQAVLDELELCGRQLEALLDEGLELSPYDEAEELPAKQERHLEKGARFGLRPRSSFRGVVYAPNAEATLATAAPRLSRLLDTLGVLAHQLDESQRADDVVTLLFEPIGVASAEAVALFAAALPSLGASSFHDDGAGWAVGGGATAKRQARVLRGPGLRALLEPWLGYGRVTVLGADGAPVRALVRCAAIDGGDGSAAAAVAALQEHDRRARAEREARRRGGPLPAEAHLRVVLEREDTSSPARFVATGLLTDDVAAHTAACLAARRSGGAAW